MAQNYSATTDCASGGYIMSDDAPCFCDVGPYVKVLQFPLVAVATMDYNAQEHSSTGEGTEGGYLSLAIEEQVHIISHVYVGHIGNKFSHYVYCRDIGACHRLRHGWVPSATLEVRDSTCDQIPQTHTEVDYAETVSVPHVLPSVGGRSCGFVVIVDAMRCVLYKVWTSPRVQTLEVNLLWSKSTFMPPGNHSKGGQSADRIMRSREQKLVRWCKHVAANVAEQVQIMTTTFKPTCIVIGGAVFTRHQLSHRLRLVRCNRCPELLVLIDSLWVRQPKHAIIQCLLNSAPVRAALLNSR
jgi:hypothetical protein